MELSVLVPVSERMDDLAAIHAQCSESLAALGCSHEFIFVLDGPMPDTEQQLVALRAKHPDVRALRLNRWFGEATALSVGFEMARAATIVTLPSYFQVDPAELTRMVERFRAGEQDLLIAWRHPRLDSIFNRLQSWAFRQITRLMTGTRLHDVSCGMRVMRSEVAREVPLYGDLHRFLPLLAYQRGFRVDEIQVRQSRRDARRRLYGPGVYLRRLLDILTLFFLFKFTKKPLRFFGLVGSALFGGGAAITAYLGVYRLMALGPLANRPLLILGVLLMVLGIQLFSIGLLGEIIIFTHAGQVKDYEIREIRG